ncbi:HHIP-like protein 2 [Mytilus trossulus]|uniref:HHIP-like protein 2 n=1 Tax=Mytilus trossulus TaxID=6551 RepID=UPI003005381D
MKSVLLLVFVFKLDLLAQQLKKSSVCICMEELSSNLDNPLIIQNAGDGTERLFVGEQKGVVHIFNQNGVKCTTPFLNITDKVKGLLGLAFHPNFSVNRRFFVYYSSRAKPKNSSDDRVTRLHEFRASRQNPDIADTSSGRLIMEIQQPFSNHNGGEIIFGDDAIFIYFLEMEEQEVLKEMHIIDSTVKERLSLLGKILRIDINKIGKRQGYGIPPDNPLMMKPRMFRPEIYAYGVRNIWRCGKESGRHNGRILCGDVGHTRSEEIDVLKKGANYGWKGREGFECYDNKTCGKTVDSFN